LLLKTAGSDARLNRLNSPAPIRSRAVEEGSFQIPLWGVPLVLFLLYVCLFSGLGALGLVGPDEPRYAAIARAMSETHDWVTPRLWGTPWFEKPVLYYWTAGIAMRLFGVSEFAARLPSALAALLAVIAVTWTALRSYGLGAAWYSLLMLPTSVAMIGFSRAASPDMLFAGLLTGAMAVAVEILQKPRPGPILRIAFGFFLGAAVLAKGPAGVVLAGGAALLWAALSRQWRVPFRFLHPLIIAVFCATALPWYVLCALRNPDFLRVFIWQHNFERYLTPVFQHPQPFWFYGYIVLLAVLPWILILCAGLFNALLHLKNKGAPESLDLFFACWALFPILFFSISQSKLPGYILPAVPPLFLLLGHWVSQAMAVSTRTLLRMLGWTGAMLLLTAIPLGSAVISGIHDLFPPGYLLAASVFFLFGILIVVFALNSRPKETLLLVALLVIPAIEIANFVILPRMDIQVSARQVAGDILKADPSGANVAFYELPRAWQYGVDFYLNRELPEWIPGRSEPDWILGRSLPDLQIAIRYKEVLDETDRGVPLDLSLYHKK
jgi:4-amino-4-deoxy-L-arabinose transferase-like glycosyltransferase